MCDNRYKSRQCSKIQTSRATPLVVYGETTTSGLAQLVFCR